MTKVKEWSDITEFSFGQLVLEQRGVTQGDRFNIFKSYKHEDIMEFINEINLLLGREMYYTESPASSIGIIMNVEKGTLIHLASMEKFSSNVIFSFLSNRIMNSLKMILSKCSFQHGEVIDLKDIKNQLSDWFDKFNIPFREDAKGRRNYPLDVKYTDSTSKENKALIIRPNMEPEYLKEIHYGYQCESCLKIGCSEREISRHCNTHRPHSNKVRGYCQWVSRGFVLCEVGDKFRGLHFTDGDVKVEKGDTREDAYFQMVQLGERKCSILNMKKEIENEFGQFEDIFQEEYRKLKVYKSKRTMLKKRKLLRFYLTEDDSSEYHFSLNCSSKTVRKTGEMIGVIITICKKLKLAGYGKIFQNDEVSIIDELLEDPTWPKFVELVVEIVNEDRVGLMRTILITLFKDYDPIRRVVKAKSFRRRIGNVRRIIFLFRMCLRWYSEFEDDALNCEKLQNSLKNKYEITTLIGEIYYPMVNQRKQRREFESQFDKDFMSFTHASGWGYHLVGVHSLNMVLKRNEEEIRRIIMSLKESCEYKENEEVGFYFKLAEEGDIDVIEGVFNDISLLMIEMLMILNPGELTHEQYLSLDLKDFSVKVSEEEDDEDVIELKFYDDSKPLNLCMEKNLFYIWYEIIRRLYYDNESGEEGKLFHVRESRDVIKHITNGELNEYLRYIRGCSIERGEWLKMLRNSWKLSGEGYIKGSVKSRTYATVFGGEYDDFSVQLNKRSKSVK